MLATTLAMNDLEVPRILYGTAWKEDRTQSLTELALRQGFRGIDTANQRRHYFEAAVGAAISATVKRGLVSREDLFLQTKFTFARGQDHRLPYKPDAPVSVQVDQSFASSIEHLGVEQVDSYLLHGPTHAVGLTQDDWDAWRAMEQLYGAERTRSIGVSNFSLRQLQSLFREARVRPHFVQNRCYASRGWDRDVRAFCSENGIVYQGFSLLTANRQVLSSEVCVRLAKQHDRSIPQVIFRFAIHVGMMVLTGTTDPDHMRDDLDLFGFELDAQDIRRLETVAG